MNKFSPGMNEVQPDMTKFSPGMNKFSPDDMRIRA